MIFNFQDKENRFLLSLLYKDVNYSITDLRKLDLEKLIFISSSHFILPLLFSKLKEKKILKYFPLDFRNYIKEIYKINKNRNNELINEVKEISSIFKKNKINHIFLKGSAVLVSKIYHEIGERMVGDIDILVEKNQIQLTKKILSERGYKSKPEESIHDYRHRHIARFRNSKKLFAIEIHDKIINNDKNNLTKRFFSELNYKSNVLVPSKINILYHCIYNIQVNDNAYNKFYMTHKNMYEVILLLDWLSEKNIDFSDKIIADYFFKLNILKIFSKKVLIPKRRRFLYRLNKKNYPIFKVILFTVNRLKNISIPIEQIVKFFKEKRYRKYLIKKLLNPRNPF